MDPVAPTHESAPPVHSHGAQDYAHVAAHVRMYIGIGILEMIMTCCTVGLSLLPVGTPVKVLLVLMSASVNAVVVAAYLMHLKQEKAIVWRFLFFTGLFTLVLFGLTLLYWSSPIHGTGLNHH